MKVGEICTRIVTFATKDMPLVDAAKLMRQHHVGSLIVVEVLAPGLDYKNLSVGEIMSSRLITARDSDDMLGVLRVMRQKGIRRMPVVTESGTLAGIVTLDDLLEILAEQMDDLVDAIAGEQVKEVKDRR